MKTLEILLNKRWILKSREKELYYQMKDEIGTVKKFLTEKLGYPVIVNPYLIKVEKMPAAAKPWMGIQEFNDKLQYSFLCMILMFLEDKDAESQFVLSELTEYIAAGYQEKTVDWTSYTCRRHLIKVMKFCVDCGMLQVDDGSEENFAKEYTGEVLYQNTGASRYFMKNFTKNIMKFTSPVDFEEGEWIDMDSDRGIIRRQRVYRNLIMSLGMYRTEENEEDFAYIRNFRNMISGELSELFDCELQIHRTSAFLVMGESGNLGRSFPEEKSLSDILLLCCNLLQEKIAENKFDLPLHEMLLLSRDSFQQLVEECKERFGAGFIQTYRKMTSGEFYREVKEYMEQLDFIEEQGDMILINPVAGKLLGRFPEDF